MTPKEILEKTKEEYVFKKSWFIEDLIIFKKSMFKYYFLAKRKHLIFHPFCLFHFYKLKNSKELKQTNKYIEKYLYENEGWYQYFYIPGKNNIKIEIYTCVGKHILNARTCGYGYYQEDDPYCSFGWLCWVKRWKFVDNGKNSVIQIKNKENYDLHTRINFF